MTGKEYEQKKQPRCVDCDRLALLNRHQRCDRCESAHRNAAQMQPQRLDPKQEE